MPDLMRDEGTGTPDRAGPGDGFVGGITIVPRAAINARNTLYDMVRTSSLVAIKLPSSS